MFNLKALFVVWRQRLAELIYHRQYEEWREQSRTASHWVRCELGKRLEIRRMPLGDGWLGIFEAELARLVYNELVARKGLYRFENPTQLSPMDLYRMALTRAGIQITPAIAEALPESQVRMLSGYVRVMGDVRSASIRLYDRWASV